MIGIQQPLGPCRSRGLSSGESGGTITSTSFEVGPFITTIIDRETDTFEVAMDAPVWE